MCFNYRCLTIRYAHLSKIDYVLIDIILNLTERLNELVLHAIVPVTVAKLISLIKPLCIRTLKPDLVILVYVTQDSRVKIVASTRTESDEVS